LAPNPPHIRVTKNLKIPPLGVAKGMPQFCAHTEAEKCPHILKDPPIPPLSLSKRDFAPEFKYLAPLFKFVAPKLKHHGMKAEIQINEFLYK